MKNELFERELQNTSINDVSLADYVKENYLPISVLDKIRAEINGIEINGQVDEHTMFIRTGEQVKQMALGIIDKHIGKGGAE